MDTAPTVGSEPTIMAQAARLAERFKALMSPMRLYILRVLAEKGGKLTVDELTELLCQTKEISQPSVTQHLRCLYDAGLVNFEDYRRSSATYRYYFVEDGEVSSLFAQALAFGLHP